MPEYREPPCLLNDGNKLGSGGNGSVYRAFNPKFVCKIFDVDNRLSPEKKEKRYKRFCNEIQTQKRLAQEIAGVLSVEDYCCPETYSVDKPAWFTMPKAIPFSVSKRKSFSEKIADLIELGRIIFELHKKNIAHRDIKPENVLIYNNRIHLADYGLVWIDGINMLTDLPERIGPIRIIPPELELCEDINKCDYRKSDVYLFAKLSWMYLNEDKYGFKGPYIRGAQQIYLDSDSFNCVSLEPLHKMLLNATKDDWFHRLDISECLNYLEKQFALSCDKVSKNERDKYVLQEKLHLFNVRVEPSYKAYTEPCQIKALLSSLIPGIQVQFEDGFEDLTITPKKIKFVSEGVTGLFEELPDRKTRWFYLNIGSAEVYDDRIIITLTSCRKLHSNC